MSEPWASVVTRRRFLARSAALAAAGGLVRIPASALARPAAGGRPPLLWALGGELQYFRSDPQHLEQRLARCAAAGYTTIQSYVAWNVHEASRGTIDFSGRTQPLIVDDHADQYQIETPDDQIAHGGTQSQVAANTDLAGYLRTLARHRFRVLLRPGPFISDEWRNGGLPDWLLEAGYPGMYMCGPDGTPLTPGAPFSTPPTSILLGGGPLYYFPSPSFASDFYVGEVRRWLTAFAAFVRPWLATNGGPVVAIQVDDENCFYYRFGPFEADYHPAMVARYRAATGTAPPTGYPAAGVAAIALRPAFEWQRFKAAQIAAFLATLAGDLRRAGVDVPIYHEEELQLSPPAGLAQIGAAVDVLHPEFYNGDSGPWSLPLNELDAGAVRAAQRHRKPLIAVEMQNSDPLLYTLLFGEGLVGGLQFTYTDGVPEDGFDAIARLGRTIHASGARLTQTRRRADTAIVWCPDQLYAPYGADRYGFERDVRRVIERDVPALATTLIRAGLSFDLLDTDVATDADYRAYPTVWLVASDILPRSAQRSLTRYVERGGRLVCWPAPPTLDERLEPCTLLARAVYPERRAAFHGEDPQQIEVLGNSVQVFRGVQTYSLSSAARAIALRAGAPCGYARRHGRGEALLLGTWPAADSVPGRAGVVFELQQVSSPQAAVGQARTLARERLGDAAAAAVGADVAQAGAGQPRYMIVYDYSNERRGGEVVTGGSVAYWDGNDVVPIVEVNSAEQPISGTPVPEGALAFQPPYRPLTAAHLSLVRALHGRALAADVSDPRIQVRVVDAPRQRSATLAVLNRFPQDLTAVIEVRVNGRRVRLPQRGSLALPAATSLLLPVDYTLAPRVVVAQATAQLLGYRVARRRLEAELYSPAGGEVVMSLPGPLAAATVGSRAVPVAGRSARLALPPGEQKLRLSWRLPAARRRPRRTPRYTG